MNDNKNRRYPRIKKTIRIVLLTIGLIFFSFKNYGQQFLKTQGQDIVNETGEKVYLKGVGLGNWMLPEGYMWKFEEGGDRPRRIEKLISDMLGKEAATDFWKSFRANYITEADIKRIAELGYNSLRPALNARLFMDEENGYKFKEEGFLLLDQLIAWCKKYQLYVIIDMHGAPGGQTGTNIDDSRNNVPELFTDMHNKDLLEALWIRIAKRYKDEPVVAAYDLLNEPLPEVTGAAEKYKDQLVPLYKRLIKAIRQVDKKHMLTIEGYEWSNDWSLFDESLDSNAFYQFHYYCWDRPDKLKSIDYFLKKRDELNVPVWVGETGEKGNTIYYGTSQYFKKNNIGWSFWPWKKMATVNTPYSIKIPVGWEKIIDYSNGGEKPSQIEAKKIFAELEQNIKLENCIYFPDVVNSMLCRLPLKVEAENYGNDGLNGSYFVNDTTFRAENYRIKEPVPIKLITFNDQHLSSEQAIQLEQNEWVKYEFESLEDISYEVELRVKSDDEKSVIDIFLNEKPISVEANNTSWEEIKIGMLNFKKGMNELKIKIKTGQARIDWINIK